MSGSLTCGDGENVPGIPGACAPAISRIWQEAHARVVLLCGTMDLQAKALVSEMTAHNGLYGCISCEEPGLRLNIKTVLSTYGDFHVKDKTAVRTSYL